MSLRQMFSGSIVKPGFNPLAQGTPIYTYYLYSWGQNTYGNLGLGNTTSYSSPKQVGSLTDWLTISAGNYSCFSVKTNNTLWAWGNNGSGRLGLGNSTSYSSPKQIGALTGWLSVSAGYHTSFAVKTNGTLWGWGANTYGNLGNGATGAISSPV